MKSSTSAVCSVLGTSLTRSVGGYSVCGWRKSIAAVRQHGLQIRVISFWFRAADEADFFRFAGRGHADALDCLRGFLFAVVLVGDLVFVSVVREANLIHVKL